MNPLFSERLLTSLFNISSKTDNYCIRLAYAINTAQALNKFSEKDVSKSITMLDYCLEKGDNLISYLAVGKTAEYSENGEWMIKNRQQGKIGKTFLTLFKYYCKILELRLPSSQELESFVNHIKAELSEDNYEFKLVSGSDIRYYYHEDNYQITSNKGYTLHNSCMRSESCQTYFEMYEKSANCEMLIMFDKSLSSDKIVGRALVWTYNGQKYVDRRYFCIDFYEVAMLNYIKSHRWSYKSENAFDDVFNTCFYEYKSEDNSYHLNLERDIVIRLLEDPDEYPYMDTLKYYDALTKKLSNNQDYISNGIILTSYDGGYDDPDSVLCEYCGTRIHLEDAYSVEGVGMCCNECVAQDYFGNYTLQEKLIEVYTGDNRHSVFIHKDDIHEYAVHYCGEWLAIPGTELDPHWSVSIFDRESMTDEEYEEFLEDHEILNDYYAIWLV